MVLAEAWSKGFRGFDVKLASPRHFPVADVREKD